jgi:hypothetical protein
LLLLEVLDGPFFWPGPMMVRLFSVFFCYFLAAFSLINDFILDSFLLAGSSLYPGSTKVI